MKCFLKCGGAKAGDKNPSVCVFLTPGDLEQGDRRSGRVARAHQEQLKTGEWLGARAPNEGVQIRAAEALKKQGHSTTSGP